MYEVWCCDETPELAGYTDVPLEHAGTWGTRHHAEAHAQQLRDRGLYAWIQVSERPDYATLGGSVLTGREHA